MNCPICGNQMVDEIKCNSETHILYKRKEYLYLNTRDYGMYVFPNEIRIYNKKEPEYFKKFNIPNFKLKPKHLSMDLLLLDIKKLTLFL